jgi:hypothetical protein
VPDQQGECARAVTIAGAGGASPTPRRALGRAPVGPYGDDDDSSSHP